MRAIVLVEASSASRLWGSAAPLFRAESVDVKFATVRPRGPLHDELASLSSAPVALGCRTSRDYAAGLFRLARLIRVWRPDVVNAVEPIPAAIGCSAGLLARRSVRIFHRQHLWLPQPGASLSRLASRLSHVTIACSQAVAEAARTEAGAIPGRVRVAYNGAPAPRPVGVAERARVRARLGIPAEAPVVTAVARLRVEKGLGDLIEAVARTRGTLPSPAHLVLVGSGPEEESLREHARRLELGDVHFVGHQDDVAPWFHTADVVAMPSWHEALPFAAAEAMACGKPVVASDVGGLPEIVQHGVTGLLVPPRDPAALARTLVELVCSPHEAARMGEAGKVRYARLFSVETMVKAMTRIWREALGGKVSPGHKRVLVSRRL